MSGKERCGKREWPQARKQVERDVHGSSDIQQAGRTRQIRTGVSFSVQPALCSFLHHFAVYTWHIKFFIIIFVALLDTTAVPPRLPSTPSSLSTLEDKSCAPHSLPTRNPFAHPFRCASNETPRRLVQGRCDAPNLMPSSQPSTAKRPARPRLVDYTPTYWQSASSASAASISVDDLPAPSLPSVEEATVSESLTCHSCDQVFATVDMFRHHFRSDWHRCNIKRPLRGHQVVTEAQFEDLSDLGSVVSLSGSEPELSPDESNADAAPTVRPAEKIEFKAQSWQLLPLLVTRCPARPGDHL